MFSEIHTSNLDDYGLAGTITEKYLQINNTYSNTKPVIYKIFFGKEHHLKTYDIGLLYLIQNFGYASFLLTALLILYYLKNILIKIFNFKINPNKKKLFISFIIYSILTFSLTNMMISSPSNIFVFYFFYYIYKDRLND